MDLEALEKMLGRGHDSAMLRLTLGNAYAKAGDRMRALEHLRQAVVLDPDYSAAWKVLGKQLAANGECDEALRAYRLGLETARRRGDMQIVRELEVFIRRLER